MREKARFARDWLAGTPRAWPLFERKKEEKRNTLRVRGSKYSSREGIQASKSSIACKQNCSSDSDQLGVGAMSVRLIDGATNSIKQVEFSS
jgi:hypothetical protein